MSWREAIDRKHLSQPAHNDIAYFCALVASCLYTFLKKTFIHAGFDKLRREFNCLLAPTPTFNLQERPVSEIDRHGDH